MAQTGTVRRPPRLKHQVTNVLMLRAAIFLAAITLWEAVAASGLFYRDVVPSMAQISAALLRLLSGNTFYANLSTTAGEVLASAAIGTAAGLAVGLLLGGSRYLSKAFEPYLYYLGPTPKIIFFPIMIMWFGVGPESKVAMGAISCFFPVALSVAAGMRQIDPVLIRVGRSFRASVLQMIVKVYLPAMRAPILNGFRLGFGLSIIGVLLAETKLSNRGIGYMINHAYSLFDMPTMYAILIIVFAIAILGNSLLARLVSAPASTH